MIELEQLRFRYSGEGFRLDVPELRIASGERVALTGPSGCGKTTLVQLIAGILAPEAGRVRIGDDEITALSDADRRWYRISRIGFVFQEFELVEYLDVRDNILLPYLVHPALPLTQQARDRAVALAEATGLGGLLTRRPRELSQGERQRVGLCRALVIEPTVILADEPTGNLDPATAGRVFDLLLAAVAARGPRAGAVRGPTAGAVRGPTAGAVRGPTAGADRATTLVMVTHDRGLLDRFDRTIDVAAFAGGSP